MQPMKPHWHINFSILALLLAQLTFLTSPTALAADNSATANKKLVLDFYNELFKAEAAGTMKRDLPAIAEKYLKPDYIQHSESFSKQGAGRDGLVRSLQALASDKPNPNFTFPTTISIMAEGDRVMLMTRRPAPSGKQVYLFNMFRVQDGKLAEHWDVLPAEFTMPPGASPQK